MSKLNDLLFDIDKAAAADSGQNAAADRFHAAAREAAKAVEERVKLADQGEGDFTVYELTYAASSRCPCGAGMAYPDDIGMHGAWYCSAILLGQAEPGTTHSPSLPFSFYSAKSEGQPSVAPATTRPAGTHIETAPTYACKGCGNAEKLPRYREGIDEDPKKSIVCSKCGEKYLNENGSSNMKLITRWLHVVVDDEPA